MVGIISPVSIGVSVPCAEGFLPANVRVSTKFSLHTNDDSFIVTDVAIVRSKSPVVEQGEKVHWSIIPEICADAAMNYTKLTTTQILQLMWNIKNFLLSSLFALNVRPK